MNSSNCLLPYFMHKYPWLKQSSSVLQKEMCQTNLRGLTDSARNLRELILRCDKMLVKSLILSTSYSSPELEKKIICNDLISELWNLSFGGACGDTYPWLINSNFFLACFYSAMNLQRMSMFLCNHAPEIACPLSV